MNILFCNYEYPPLGGGGGVFNALVAQELAKRHTVTVLTSQGLGLPAESTERGVRVVRVPVLQRKAQATASMLSMLSFLPAGWRRGVKLLNEQRFDVINTHFVLPTGPLGDALARRAGIPNVLSLHGGDLYDPSKASSPHRNPLLRAWVRQLLRRADLVVGQSSNTLKNMRNIYTPELTGECIPLGIERPPQGAANRADYGFGENDVLLVTVGRLVARKGLGQLLAMIEGLGAEPAKSNAARTVRLIVIGSGPLDAALRAEAQERGVADRVHFLGQIDEAEKYRVLHMADIYVSTSQHEGFGLVFLEGLACELPVVCYDHGGQTDFLDDNETGFLVELNDEATFLQRTQQLIDNPALRHELGIKGRARAEAYFIDNSACRYEDVFLKACLERNHQGIKTPSVTGSGTL